MARFRDGADAIPEKLVRFVPSEWPGEVTATEDAATRWGAAALEWVRAHEDAVEADGIRLSGAHGPVELLAEITRLRQCLRTGAPLDTPIRDVISGRWRVRGVGPVGDDWKVNPENGG